MRAISLGLAAILLAAACGGEKKTAEPLAPGANGRISIASSVAPASWRILEIRGFPAREEVFDGVIPSDPGVLKRQSIPLDQAAFPLEYTSGGESIGVTGLPRFRVVAWLSSDDSSESPSPGEPTGTTSVVLSDCSAACSETCYCGITRNADFTLATPP